MIAHGVMGTVWFLAAVGVGTIVAAAFGVCL
jgi:hypothetical protein